MGSRDPAASESLIKFNIQNIDLKVDPSPELIFHQLVTNIKWHPFVDLIEMTSLVKSNGWKNLERILLLDQGQFQMFAVGTHNAAISVIHHILGQKYWTDVFGPEWLKLL